MKNPTVRLPSGEKVAALGIGTWRMAERRSERADEIRTLQLAVDWGMNLIDTAEMYGDGKTETLVGEAIAGIRDKLFLVSKVYPHNASRNGVIQACERSLKRLKTDRLDLYLLHWPSNTPLRDTVSGFESLLKDGKIRQWGVSNFDIELMQELYQTQGGKACAANQILYNLSRREPEYALFPWMAERKIPAMAYSPFEQGRLKPTGVLKELAEKHDAKPYQIALAWCLSRENLMVIPKTGNEEHLRENFDALKIKLDPSDHAALDKAFKPPARKKPLDML